MLKKVLFVIILFIGFPTVLFCERHKDNTFIKVGVYNNPPKIFINAHGRPDGIFIDVLKAIALKEGLIPEYIVGDWQQLINMLAKGEIDVLPDMAYSEKRDSLFNFNNLSVINTWLEIYTTKRTPVTSIIDLQNKKVGVLKGSYQEDLLNNKVKKDFNLSFKILTYNNYAETVQALKNNEADVMVADRFFYFSDIFDDQIHATGVVFHPNELYFGFSKKIPGKVLTLFDNNISKLKNDTNSEFYISTNKWLDIHKHEHVISPFLRWFIIIISIFSILAIAFIILLRNTVKYKTAELMVAKQNAEESDRLKTVFLQNISHEIRTPMNGILGFIELLNDEELVEKDKKNYMDIVTKSGQRLLNTINDVIEISKIESGQISLHYSNVNIGEMMTDLYEFFRKQANEKNIRLLYNSNLQEKIPLIETDRSLAEKILVNLLRNAIKFTTEGSVEFGYYREKNDLIFYVNDTGCGIPADRHDAILERFVQSDLNLTRAHEGSGLGLAIAKAYIELLGGKIKLESEENKGSKFYFNIPYIPVKQKENTMVAEKISLVQLNKQITILIAEDDEFSYMYLENILRNDLITIIHTTNGIDAVEIMKSNPDITMILMDIKMPQMNGLVATRHIRDFNRSVPVIAQTAYAFKEDKEEIFESGCTDFITKPINRTELIRLIFKYS
ncbi:Sensor histidine kinase RcsC [bioreactor metagenome]|uniref:histidine kinase n=1 Tax=bioreactor metagenome TaxID=1076179 RepID=A0A644Z3Y0_9ZZZZ|nr:transporter substrate-binding domain-containing protein [Paludibacter sp.]